METNDNNHRRGRHSSNLSDKILKILMISVLFVFTAFTSCDIIVMVETYKREDGNKLIKWLIANILMRLILYIKILINMRNENYKISHLDISLAFARILMIVFGMELVFGVNNEYSIKAPILYTLVFAHIICALCSPILIMWLGCMLYMASLFTNNKIGNQLSEYIIKKDNDTFNIIHTKTKNTIVVIEKEDALCCICLEDYKLDDNLRLFNCQHHFHKNCVDKWLATSNLCPICKQNVHANPV